MNVLKPWASALAVTALIVTPMSWGACSKATIEGKFVGELLVSSLSDQRTSNAAIMLNFNGKGGLQIIRMTEWVNRDFRTSVGGGSYGLGSNCIGVANLNIKRNGIVITRGQINFYVRGNASKPEILGHFYDKDDESTGSVHLVKSSF